MQFPCSLGWQDSHLCSCFQVYNLVTNKVSRTIGQEETIRLNVVSLCRAVPDVRTKLQGAAATVETETADNPNLNKTYDPDPVMVSLSVLVRLLE